MDRDAILYIALPLIKGFEGFRAKPYLDQVNRATIGYGTTFYLDGRRVSMSDPGIDEPTASNLLLAKITSEFMPGLISALTGVSGMNSNQYAAVLSLMYNMGVSAISGSTLVRDLKAGDFSAAANQFDVWNHAGGVENKGLTNRRAKEKQVFLSAV